MWWELQGKNGSKPPCIAWCAKWTWGLGVERVDVAVVGFVCVVTRAWEFWPETDTAIAGCCALVDWGVDWPLEEESVDAVVGGCCCCSCCCCGAASGADVVAMFWLMIWPAMRIMLCRNSGVGPFKAPRRTGKRIKLIDSRSGVS